MVGAIGRTIRATRRGVAAVVLGVAGTLTGGDPMSVMAAAEEAGIVPERGEAWDGEVSGGRRLRRRTRVCQADVGDEFLTCTVRCRKKQRLVSGGCLFVSGEAMNLVQHGPLSRRRYACQWTSFPEGGIIEPSAYRAVVLCDRKRP